MIRIILLLLATTATVAATEAGDGNIERRSPAFDVLVAKDAKIEKLADGFQFTEGPLWIKDGGYLLFSDIPGNRIIRWSEADGASTYLEPILAPDADTGAEGGANGLTLSVDGDLIIAEHGNRRLAKLHDDLSRTTIADKYGSKRFSSPNDVVSHSDGSLYFTDPPYGLPEQDLDPQKQLDWNGVYRLTKAGQVRLLTDLSRPNGLAFSPDESILYVADSDPGVRTVTAYEVLDDGTLGEGEIFLDLNVLPYTGSPDGIKVDKAGNVWTTGSGGVWVITPAGEILGGILPDERPSNLAFGDNGKTLYMTARTGLYRIHLLAEGPIP